METDMDLRHALALSLSATHNARYMDHRERVVRQIGAGSEIHEVLSQTGAFPREFLDTLEVGERAGRLPESMAILAKQYQEQARRTMAMLTVVGGFAVWGLVAVMIIFMIFRVFSFFLFFVSKLFGSSLQILKFLFFLFSHSTSFRSNHVMLEPILVPTAMTLIYREQDHYEQISKRTSFTWHSSESRNL